MLDAQNGADVLFLAPTHTLTINLGGATPTIATVNLGGASLIVNQGEEITVAGNLSAGTIILNALRKATVADGAAIQSPGDVTIAVNAGVELDVDRHHALLPRPRGRRQPRRGRREHPRYATSR